MKFQLVILSALLVSAFALPVPDEEVSPVVQAASQTQEKSVELLKTEEKIIDAIKPAESRAAEILAAVAPAASTPSEKKEEKPAELLLNTPDAELSLSLPALKEDKKDKQTRADDQAEEAKALPVIVAAPAAAVIATAEETKLVEEAKPLVPAEQPLNIEGKSTIIAEAAPAEQKKEVLSAAEETPLVKSDATLVASADTILAETKKEETPARQERVGEAVNEIEGKDAPVAPIVPVAPAVVDVVPGVKSLLAEESAPLAASAPLATPLQPVETEKQQQPELVGEQLKTAASEPVVGKVALAAQAPAGDIPQLASEESAPKALKAEAPAQAPIAAAAIAAPEPKKVEEPAVAASAPAELQQEQQKEIKPEVKESEPKTLDEKKPAEAAKLSESKKSEEPKDSDSSDSSESKESGESKEDKSD